MKEVKLADGITYTPVISRRFICPKCRIFCQELVPIYKHGMAKKIKKAGAVSVKVFCKNGCHLRFPDWGWEIFKWGVTSEENNIKSWPDQWRR